MFRLARIKLVKEQSCYTYTQCVRLLRRENRQRAMMKITRIPNFVRQLNLKRGVSDKTPTRHNQTNAGSIRSALHHPTHFEEQKNKSPTQEKEAEPWTMKGETRLKRQDTNTS